MNGGEYFSVMTFADDKAAVQTAINVMAAGLAGFGFLTLLASAFGIINTQYISVLERTSQIGLMKSLGMRKSDVSKLFRYEAALIGLFGGIITTSNEYIVLNSSSSVLAVPVIPLNFLYILKKFWNVMVARVLFL